MAENASETKKKKNEYFGGTNPSDSTYPGPLRGGRVCAAFDALLQAAFIAPHRAVCRKPSGGVNHKGMV